MRTCKKCGEQYFDDVIACPKCNISLLPPPVKRTPVGLILVGVLQFLAGLILMGLAALIWYTLQEYGGWISESEKTWANLGALVLLVLGGGSLVLSWGLWTLKKWARAWTLVVRGLDMAISGLIFLAGQVEVSPALISGLVVDGIVIWYLLRDDVKQLF